MTGDSQHAPQLMTSSCDMRGESSFPRVLNYVLPFGSHLARPRVSVIGLDLNAWLFVFLAAALLCRHHRIPVFTGMFILLLPDICCGDAQRAFDVLAIFYLILKV